MSENQSTNTEGVAKQYEKPAIGNPITEIKDVPKEIRDQAVLRAAPKNHKGEILKDEYDKPILPQIMSAKENGSYRGQVVLNSDKYLIQAVGKNSQFLIVHEKGNVALQGESLQERNAQKRMNGASVQVHYSGQEAKAYPYSAQKDAERRDQARAARAEKNPALSQGDLVKRAQEYAAAEIKNPKQREAFLKHMEAVTEKGFQAPAKEQSTHSAAKPAQSKDRAKEPELSR